MLLEFRISNFRSYAAEKRFSMVAGSGKELLSNTMTVDGFHRYSLLRGAAIYGANASGKSNLIHAFAFFRRFVLGSSESRQEGDEIPVYPFLLDPKLANSPSHFEMTFLLDGVRHQYGFVVSRERVHEEWLTVYPKGKPQEWFHRTLDPAGKSTWSWSRTHLRGDKSQLADRTRDNALFLSVAAQWNHAQITPIYNWFRNYLRVLPKDVSAMTYTRGQLLNDSTFREWLTRVLKAADTGVSEVLAKESKIHKDHLQFPREIPDDARTYLTESILNAHKVEVRTTRRLPGSDKEIEWDLEQESDGTQRMLELLGPIYDVLQQGAVLVMDELDTSLHAYITRELVQLFNNPKTNPGHAQLVFTTHDTSLLDPTLFRRDQVWFTAKDATGETDLYSLEDFSPRKGEALQKGYLVGRYGAVPVLERFAFAQSPRRPDKADLVGSES
jgi:AAA15 family ATPase/GTPase